MITEIAQHRKLKRVAMAAAIVGMGIGLTTALSGFTDSGGGGTGSGDGCTTTAFLYVSYKTQDKASNVPCSRCTKDKINPKIVKDSAGIQIGILYDRVRETVLVTRRDCKPSDDEHQQCNEISVTSASLDCSIYVPGPGTGGSGAGM